MAPECSFCSMDRGRVVAWNSLAFAIRDGYPVSPGRTLAIPHRHVDSFFELSPQEHVALFEIVREQKRVLDAEFAPIGINDGPAAGQTVAHVHVHLIPRYQGDVADPRGGVRWVLPAKSRYWTEWIFRHVAGVNYFFRRQI
jgi:diadenosine tetraphosphate (Ap4A) HIT family hydrolase